MSMMMVSAWVKNPVVGWEQVGVDTSKPYGDLNEAMADFAAGGREGGYKILRSWARTRAGSATVYRMEMRTRYQLEHPGCNQTEWEAEITVLEE